MAKKKIYDIMPPKLAHKVENTIKSMVGDDSPKRGSKKTSAHHKKVRFPFKEIFIGGTIILILLCIYFYNKLPRADIEIWPKTETLSLQENIKADKSADAVDFAKKIIPAQYLEVQQDGMQEFQATGSASNDGKATGTIRIYNKINPSSSFILKTGTHFLSDSGKYFVTLEKITIPETKGSTPGSIDVKVQAEESGSEYNISASKFSVPKLSGTSYYYSIWADSNSAMSGGYTGKIKKVTKNDITNARDNLTKQLLDQAEKSLRDKLSEGDILLDGAITKNIIDAKANVKEGAVVDKFNESATVKISALVFKKQDLEEFARNDVLSQLPDTRKFLEKSLSLDYSPQSIDMQSGSEMVNLQLSAKTYYIIDTINLVDSLSMKSADQIKQVIDEKYGDTISELKVNFWPFWVASAPQNKNRIKVDLLFQ